MRVVGYARVSTEAQAERGLGLETQQAELRSWARREHHRLVGIEVDAGRSGTLAIANRPALLAAFRRVADGKAEGIAVVRLDRLARDLILQEQLLAEVHRLGGQLLSTSPVEQTALLDDAADPQRKLVRRILGAVAEYEREMIRLRMNVGKARKLAAGGYAHGAPGYGYRARAGELVAQPEEQAVLRRIRRLRRGGASLREIAGALNDEGVRTRAGCNWSPSSVARLCRDDLVGLASGTLDPVAAPEKAPTNTKTLPQK